MNNKIVLGIIGVVVLLGAAYALTRDSGSSAMVAKKSPVSEQSLEAMEKKESMPGAGAEDAKTPEQPPETMVKTETVPTVATEERKMMEEAVATVGSYEPYAMEKLSMAKEGKVVLFFKASWCPSCRALDTAIKGSRAEIPAGVTILEVDYDNSTELKKKYGVTSQHTLIQVDALGEQVTKWSGGTTLDSVLQNLK